MIFRISLMTKTQPLETMRKNGHPHHILATVLLVLDEVRPVRTGVLYPTRKTKSLLRVYVLHALVMVARWIGRQPLNVIASRLLCCLCSQMLYMPPLIAVLARHLLIDHSCMLCFCPVAIVVFTFEFLSFRNTPVFPSKGYA